MLRLIALIAFSVRFAAATAPISLPWIKASSTLPGKMVDPDGRVRIFHGVNAVNKGFPWYWTDFLENPQHIQDLQDWGINFVRLGWMWSGAEPASGEFNGTYFQITAEIVNTLAAHGIYTMFDMHEDGFSSLFCLYDGIPLWVVNKRSPPREPFPWPLNDSVTCYERFWEENFFAEAMGQAYQDLYNNHNGMMSDMVNFWTKSAAYFSNYSSVIGYELINEPWAGDIYADPFLMVPGNAGSKNLMPLYNNLTAGIRSVDKQHLVFYEPVTWGMVFNSTWAGTGFTQVPGGPEWAEYSVLSYHYYCPLYSGQATPFDMYVCDELMGPQVFNAIDQDTATIGGASMLTEWGMCDPRLESGATECDTVQSHADYHFQSWAWWDYAGLECYTSNGTAIPEYVAMLSRTYARAIAGIPSTMTFNKTTSNFTVCYYLPTINEGEWKPVGVVESTPIGLQTEIYHNPAVFYPGGAAITTTPNVVASVVGNIVTVVPSATANSGELACVSLNKQ